MKPLLSALLCAATLSLAPVASAATITYAANLTGPAEEPPNASPGNGSATVQFDPVAHTLRVAFNFKDLIGTTTAGHIHGPTAVPGTGIASVATQVPHFPFMPIGVSSGAYDATFNTTDAATYNPAFVTASGGTAAGAEAALATFLAAGTGYLNIHSTAFEGGEIRGFLNARPAPIPLPAGAAPMLVALAGLVALRRWRKA